MSTISYPHLDPAPNAPLYQQLYDHLRLAILHGELRGGTKLPSTRALAEELNLSRNTVLNAYDQLMAEGYLESIQGSGTFIARVLPDLLLSTPGQNLPRNFQQRTSESHSLMLSNHTRLQMAVPKFFVPPLAGNGLPHPFNSGLPALDAFPYEIWMRLVTWRARHLPPKAFAYHNPAGYHLLREAIATHAMVSRRLRCTPEQIVITSGAQAALNLAARVLINSGDAVWMEDPGYLNARGAFLGCGADIIPVPVDQEGLVVEAGVARAPHARLVYVTPSHQFPLGVTMSLKRRLALLEWAECAGAYILEDDYDREFRFSGRPLAALQGLDTAEHVIYLGTFSKSVFPALRIGYLILPQPLIEPFLAVRQFIDIHPPLMEQAVLADFIAQGHFDRHLRRMRTLYAERRAALLDAVSGLPLEIDSPETGIHCVGWLPDEMDDQLVIREAAALDLDVCSISLFSMEPLPRNGLLLGYGGFSVQEIKDGVSRLAVVMRKAAQ